jgi:hypothetical protein
MPPVEPLVAANTSAETAAMLSEAINLSRIKLLSTAAISSLVAIEEKSAEPF